MNPFEMVVAIVFLVTIFVTMAIGVPVAFALMFCGLVLMQWMGVFNSSILSQQMIQGANTFTLLAIPFFLLAGELMNAGGLSKRIVAFALAWVGHLRGGLGYVAIIAAGLVTAWTASAWPDLAVGLGIAALNADAAREVWGAAREEHRAAAT